MKTKQALVAIGGKGNRLKAGGVAVPWAKSFLMVCGKPMLYWCLCGLYKAGVRRLVLAAEEERKLEKGKGVLKDFPLKFSKVDFFKSEYLSSHSLPYQTRHLLDDWFFAEAGHIFSEPEHYCKMDRKRGSDCIFSLYRPDSYSGLTYRVLIRVSSDKIEPIDALTGATNEFIIGYPKLLNRQHISKLPSLEFDLAKIVNFYCCSNKMKFVLADLPPDVHIKEEMKEYFPIYERYIERLDFLPKTKI